MNKRIVSLLLALLCCVLAAAAFAEETTGVAYGVYACEGESPDSLIRVTLTCEDGKVTAAQIDEKLLPYSVGGAQGWAELTDESAALLGDAVLEANGKTYPASFSLDGVVFAGAADEAKGLVYTGSVGGADVALMDYICTDEGGAWYFACESAQLLDGEGNAVAEAAIGTKASIEHGVAFWPSDITFPGNIERIGAYLVESGVSYEMDDVKKGDDGVWAVADVVTGATLAGTPNYLRIAKDAYAKATVK